MHRLNNISKYLAQKARGCKEAASRLRRSQLWPLDLDRPRYLCESQLFSLYLGLEIPCFLSGYQTFIGITLRSIMNPFIENVKGFSVAGSITVDDPNIISAFETFLRFPREHCVAHNMHLSVMEVLTTGEVHELIEKLRYIVKVIRKSPKKTAQLRIHDAQLFPMRRRGDAQIKNEGRTLKIDVKTRFNSIWSMIHRALELKASIIHVTMMAEFRKTFGPEIQLTPDEWSRLEELDPILEILPDFMGKISASSYPTLALAWYYIKAIFRYFGNVENYPQSELVRTCFNSLRANLVKRFTRPSDLVLIEIRRCCQSSLWTRFGQRDRSIPSRACHPNHWGHHSVVEEERSRVSLLGCPCSQVSLCAGNEYPFRSSILRRWSPNIQTSLVNEAWACFELNLPFR